MRIDWKPLISAATDIDADFLMRWVEKESDGNPCSKGIWGGPWEAGIAQVYYDKNQRNASVFGATIDQLRTACELDTQRQIRDLTDAEKALQVSSLVKMADNYLGIARTKLAALGLNWAETDVQCLAKLYHALPVLATSHLSYAAQNGHADYWDDFDNFESSSTREEIIAIDAAMGYAPGKGAAPFWPIGRFFDNARYVGKGV